MKSYLIYHPPRINTNLKHLKIYHDNFSGNQDPYLWNRNFLHTYCHITQLSNEIGQINFWVSGDTYPNFTQLFCDCIFVIEQKIFWIEANRIERNSPVVDNHQTYEHHYKWVNSPYNQHHFKKRRRYTLKAEPDTSFQPQDDNQNLIDILPFLEKNGIRKEVLIKKMTSRMGSRPCKLHELKAGIGQKLYEYLNTKSMIKVTGQEIENKHPHWNSIGNEPNS